MFKKISELAENYCKLEVDIDVIKKASNVLWDEIFQVKQKSWINEQYSRPQCIKTVGIPERMILEDTKVNIFVELHVSINPVPKLQKGLRRHFHPKTFQNGNCKVDDFSVLIAKSFFL